MNLDGSIVPYSNHNVVPSDNRISANGSSTEGAMLCCNSYVAVNGRDEAITVREEAVVLVNDFQRERLEHEIWETRRRIEEQGFVLDMRSQQLLNYTHEHVQQNSAVSERRLEAFVEGKMQSSEDCIQDNFRELSQNLALQIQEQLCSERQRNAEDIEMRPQRQFSQFQQRMHISEELNRADVRGVAEAQVRGWNEQLEGMKLWTREYIDSSMQAQDNVNGAKQTINMKKYVDNRFGGFESRVDELVSARIREEKTEITKSVQSYVSQAVNELEKRVDVKIASLTDHHNIAYAELKKEMNHNLLRFQNKVYADVIHSENDVGARLKAEVIHEVGLHEKRLTATIQQEIKSERQLNAEILGERVDAAVKIAVEKAKLCVESTATTTALQDCLHRQIRLNFATTSTTPTRTIDGKSNATHNIANTESVHATDRELFPKTDFARKCGSRKSSLKNSSKLSKIAMHLENKPKRRRSKVHQCVPTQFTLEQVRAESTRDVAKRAAERADELNKLHKMKTRSQVNT